MINKLTRHDRLKRRLGELPAAAKKKRAARKSTDQNEEGGDEDSEPEVFDLSEMREETKV
jgi:hypothetical protein